LRRVSSQTARSCNADTAVPGWRSLYSETHYRVFCCMAESRHPLRRGVDLKHLASHDGLRDTVNLSEGWGKTGEGDSPCVTLFFLPRTNALTLDCS
jgi:hypothetical protein